MSSESDGRDLAQKFRKDHGLGLAPIGDLIELIDQACGIDVGVLDAEAGAHGLIAQDPVLNIGVARSDRPMRHRSTIAHDLGHIMFNDVSDGSERFWSERTHEESRADSFARHLIVPIEGVKSTVPVGSQVGQVTLSRVVRRFGASAQIVAIQLCEAGLISAAQKQEWMQVTTPNLASRFGWMDEYRALQSESMTLRAPRRLTAWATAGYVERVLPLAAISWLRGAPIAEIEREFEEAAISPIAVSDEPTAQLGFEPATVDLSGLDDDD